MAVGEPTQVTGSLTDRFAQSLVTATQLTAAEARVAQYIDQNRATTLMSSAAELARRTGTSDATVIRTVQALGFTGMSELRQNLAETLGHYTAPAENMRRTLADAGEDVERAISLVLETHQKALATLRSQANAARITTAVRTLLPSERVLVFGIGPSAPLAQYAAAMMTRNGRRAGVLDATGLGLADQLLDVRTGDAVLILAYGKLYSEVATVMAEARRLALPVVLVTDSTEEPLLRGAHVVIPAPRGKADEAALHAVTLAALEALVLGLAACASEQVISTLERLGDLRRQVTGHRTTRHEAATLATASKPFVHRRS